MKYFKGVNKRYNKGMTYMELIIVIAIFATMSSVSLFNYKKFQAKVDIKNLANDIALKLVEAQKFSTSGKWNSLALAGWKPSYGVYFNLSSSANTGNNIFYTFVDLDTRNQLFDYGLYSCPNNECLSRTTITKGNTISELRVVYQDSSSTLVPNDLNVTFTRPNSGAVIKSSGTSLSSNISYAQIKVLSFDTTVTSTIKIYTSGRVQIN